MINPPYRPTNKQIWKNEKQELIPWKIDSIIIDFLKMFQPYGSKDQGKCHCIHGVLIGLIFVDPMPPGPDRQPEPSPPRNTYSSTLILEKIIHLLV